MKRNKACRFIMLLLILVTLYLGFLGVNYFPVWQRQLTRGPAAAITNTGSFDQDETSYKDINYTARLEQVRNVCQTLPEYGKRVHVKATKLQDIFVNDKYKFLYCAIPKVSSTTWKKLLLKLSGFDVDFNVSATEIYDFDKQYRRGLESMSLKHYSAAGIKYRLKNYFKFVVVRDPLERLLSAYRNKFHNENNTYFPHTYGRQIIGLYRKNPSSQDMHTGADVSFAEFVQFVVDPLTGDEQKSNAHWKTYYDLCLPCVVKYNLIAKYETLAADARHILKLLNVADQIKFPKRSLNYQYTQTSELVEEAYRNVSMWQLKALWDTFRLDFEMFGYEFQASKSKKLAHESITF
ncbi:carbohydrate sulfotransferase 11-like [Tubulanus polymorphus]|uniref:carbohydrate sulfotransferase 11-like n=1 Tax=Tubulanus polymorphus TaxID=672921 RepID=UPI003DA61D47